MLESLVFAVDVGDEVFRTFRQVEDCLEIDYFTAGGLLRREILR